MEDLNIARAEQQYGGGQLGQIRRSTLTERLRASKSRLEQELAQINSVLESLEKNPELQEVIDKVYSLNLNL